MPLLSLSGTNDPPWYPVSIARLEGLLEKAIQTGHGYHTAKALRKNIAYNLQYLEFLDRSLQDLKLSGVLETQPWKVFIIVSCGIIESLLHYLLVRRGLHTTTEWELKVVLPGNTKNVDGEPIKADVHISKKLSKPRLKQMTFDSMIQKAKAKCLLGSKMDLYKDLDQLRDLRNKVHLQAIVNRMTQIGIQFILSTYAKCTMWYMVFLRVLFLDLPLRRLIILSISERLPKPNGMLSRRARVSH
jgi:hypothetical protein